MALVQHLTTAEELLRMPEDDRRYELVEGELRAMAPAGFEHGRWASRLNMRLELFVEQQKLGVVFAAETGFLLRRDPDTVRAPDVSFVTQARYEAAEPKTGYFPGAPDLAVEVLSPSDTYSEVQEKALAWLDAGCRMVLVIDGRKRHVIVYRSRSAVLILGEADTLDGDDVVPGWKLPVGDIFG